MTSKEQRSALLQRLFWRLHFWSGIITAPLVIFAALSGLLYVFTPQIEAWKHASLDRVNTIAPTQSLDLQIAAAQRAYPDQHLRTIIPAFDSTQTTQFIFGDKKKRSNKTTAANEHAEHAPVSTQAATTQEGNTAPFIAYLNPGTLEVQGQIAEDGRVKEWARKLHSTLLQGEGWRWLIELAACWMLFMLISGIYLWWPRGEKTWKTIFRRDASTFDSKGKSRRDWRYFHSTISFATLLLTLTIIVTGITWAKYAGENFRQMQAALNQSSPGAPQQLHSSSTESGVKKSAQDIFQQVQTLVPGIQMQLSPPKGKDGVWRVESFDRTQPTKRFQMIIDAYSGAVLYRSGWNEMPFLAKATAVGIPFHRGEFGWWNQSLLVVVVLSVLFAVISGYVMWLKRRKASTISAPKVNQAHGRAVPIWLWMLFAAMGYALPVFGISLFILIAAELIAGLLNRASPAASGVA